MRAWNILLKPGIYRIAVGARLGPQLISELEQGHTILHVWDVDRAEECGSELFARVFDQSDLLVLLNEIHGVGLPISSVAFVTHDS